MSRTAYHRAYYYANVERRRASARAARRKAREWQAVIRIVSQAVTEARNENPPLGGLTRLRGSLTLKLQFQRDESLTGCSSPVNHPTTPCSGMLVGETTRSIALNLDRGGQPQDAQRVAGKREWHRETGKSSPQRMAPSVINSARSKLRRSCVSTVRIHHQSSGF